MRVAEESGFTHVHDVTSASLDRPGKVGQKQMRKPNTTPKASNGQPTQSAEAASPSPSPPLSATNRTAGSGGSAPRGNAK
jgi:hypothetical protein